MTIKERIEQALIAANLPTTLISDMSLRNDVSEAWRIPYYPDSSSFRILHAPREWCIHLADIVGKDKTDWYMPLIANSFGVWSSCLVAHWVDADEPENIKFFDSFFIEHDSALSRLKSSRKMNLDGLGMTMNAGGQICLAQRSRPFRMVTNKQMKKFDFAKNDWIENLIVTIRNFKRLADFADKPLTDVNAAITGFNKQILQIKTKNRIVNESL